MVEVGDEVIFGQEYKKLLYTMLLFYSVECYEEMRLRTLRSNRQISRRGQFRELTQIMRWAQMG